MASLLDDIESEQKASNPNRCCINRIRGQVSKEDFADLESALSNEEVTGSAIHRALARRGVKVDPKGIANHRKGTCACFR